LSSSYQQRLTGALQALLSPLAYSSTLAWRGAVNASLALLLDADRVAFSIPGEEPDLVSGDARAECIHSETDPPTPSERRLALGAAALELGAFNRASLLCSRLSAGHEGELASDYIVVNEACDWLVLAAEVPSARAPARVAGIVVHTDPAAGRSFGSRGLALTRLLVPAFRAGIITHCRMARARNVMPGEPDVRARFGLTPREASVCLLLARGKTNDEISAALCISRYTARRHTEKVLLKLHVKSRAEIAPTLLEPDGGHPLPASS
jgi:DNA-binding CsgD family transcriptional regulator